MAKPYLTLPTVPATVYSGVFFAGTLSTTTSSPLYRIVCVDLDWKMSKRQGANGSWSSAGTRSATKVSDELRSQLQTKLLQAHLPCSAEVPQENEAVRDGDIEEEVIHILIKLLASLSALIVPPELVAVVHSSHEPVVQENSQWTWDGDPGPIQLPPLHLSNSRGLAVACHSHHHLPVLPSSSTHLALLDSFRFSPIK